MWFPSLQRTRVREAFGSSAILARRPWALGASSDLRSPRHSSKLRAAEEIATGDIAAGEIAAWDIAAGEITAMEIAAGDFVAKEIAAGEIAD